VQSQVAAKGALISGAVARLVGLLADDSTKGKDAVIKGSTDFDFI